MGNFNNYYSENSNIYLFEIDDEQIITLMNQGVIYLDHDGNGKTNWQNIKEADLVIFYHANTSHCLYTAIALDKKIVIDYLTPFAIKVKLIGSCQLNFGNVEDYVSKIEDSVTTFKQAWNICKETDAEIKNIVAEDEFSIKITEEYSVKIACTKEDFKFINEISRNHKFGGASFFCAIILFNKTKRIAAALISYSEEGDKRVSKSRFVFGENESEIKQNALFIKRLLTINDIEKKNLAHRYLLKFIIDYSELFFSDGCSLIEGVSYDYNVEAHNLGFNIVPPAKINDVYYYWKPGEKFDLQGVEDKKLDDEDISNFAHKNLNEKSKVNFWLIQASLNEFENHKYNLSSREKFSDKYGNLIKVSDIIFFDTASGLYSAIVKNKNNVFENSKIYQIVLSETTEIRPDIYIQQFLENNLNKYSLLEREFALYLLDNDMNIIEYNTPQIPEPVAFWGINIRKYRFDFARQSKSWFLKDFIDNRIAWKKVKRNDIAVIFDEYSIIALAIVKDRHEDNDSLGESGYPLTILFKSVYTLQGTLYLEYASNYHWLSKRVGIFSIPKLFVQSEFKKLINLDTIIKHMNSSMNKGEMTIRPNPFFIRNNTYQAKPKQIFLVIAFSLLENIQSIISNILEPEGYTIVSAREKDGQVLFQDIWELLNESEIVIVDFTGKKPNVYLEFGMAVVLGKPIIAITQNDKDIPSDVANIKFITYKDQLGDTTLQRSIKKKIVDTMAQFEKH